MRRHSYRYQRTIARPAELLGVGLLTGASVRLRFHPAPPSTGVVFLRTDLRPVVVRQDGASLALYPPTGDELKISYALDYGLNAPIDRQRCTQVITPGNFANNLAGCRTFLLEAEAA